MTIHLSNWNSHFSYWIVMFVPCISCYNLDTKFPILYENGPPGNYFGFSVGLLQTTGDYRALITAPRSNSSFVTLFHQPGVLFSCNIPLNGDTPSCGEFEVDNDSNLGKERGKNYFRYKDNQDDMWLGVSLDVQPGSNNNSAVVCGHLWKNELENKTSINGVCYVINLDTDEKVKLLPLLYERKQITNSTYYYAYGQTGASASFSEDGLHLLLGCPGFYNGSGNVVSYEMKRTERIDFMRIKHSIPETSKLNHSDQLSFNGYVGYSVTSGKFYLENVTYIAAGAPRDGKLRGRVYIVDLRSKKELEVHERIEGKQLGGYFGASVSGIDLNADNLTDLLVGAPFYSKDCGGDEGRVYVYISNETELVPFAELSGQNKLDSRFGTCIGNVGDLNQDGFNDVAVGAPYEDEKGAVYIYHGSGEGINSRYAQRIGAEEINTMISGFGISISRGLDIDNNSYPDVLIGSYSSSNAVLLRTYPVIQVSSELQFDPPKISRNITDCDFDGERLPCFNVTYCLWYSGKYAPPSVEFRSELTMDSATQINLENPRGFLLVNGTQQSSVSRNWKLFKERNDTCFQETAYIHSCIRDGSTAVQFFLRFNLLNGTESVCQNSSFSKNCPVIDPNSPTNMTKSVDFQIDLESDDVSDADLAVEAYISGNPNNTAIVIGQSNTLTLGVIVTNRGATACAPTLSIRIPLEVSIVKQNLCSVRYSPQDQYVETTLQCDLGNSIKTGKSVNTKLTIDQKNIPVTTTFLNISFEAYTDGANISNSDSKFHLPITFRAFADIGITGTPEDGKIYYTEEESAVLVTHRYYVINHGPSPVDKIEINLSVPTGVKESNGLTDFVTLTELDVGSGKISPIPVTCNNSDTSIKFNGTFKTIRQTEWRRWNQSNATNHQTEPEIPTQAYDVSSLSGIQKTSVEENTTSTGKERVHVMDCETPAACETIYCFAGPLYPGNQKSMRITLSVTLNFTVLSSAMEDWDVIKFITRSRIFMSVASVVPEVHADEISVKTVIARVRPSPPPEVQKWIIFSGIGVGTLLLLIILIMLIKFGFFKRQQKKKLDRMMFQASLGKQTENESADDERKEQ